MNDTIERQAVIDVIFSEPLYEPGMKKRSAEEVVPAIFEKVKVLPSAQPELTDDRAIKHLQSTGWMQNHDKEMYEMGLKERLADDSGSYDSLIPCEDTISRQAAIDAVEFGITYAKLLNKETGEVTDLFKNSNEELQKAVDRIEALPPVQPEQSNASEFWRKRADFYSNMCMNLIGEMGKGVKIESVKISENGIEFIKEQPPAQPERKKGKWIRTRTVEHDGELYCDQCGQEHPEQKLIWNYCPTCGADMRGEQ